MRKLVCTCCGGRAEFESELFPTIRVCFRCTRSIGGWLVKYCESALDDNPLVTDLLDQTWSQGGAGEGRFMIVHESLHGSGASSSRPVKRFGN